MAQVIDINERRGIQVVPTLRPNRYRVAAPANTPMLAIEAVARAYGGELRNDTRGGFEVVLPDWQPDGAA